MTVTEALKILQRAPKDQPRFAVVLACGFTPLHLQLFLTARLQERLPNRSMEMKTGVYGNLAVTLENLAGSDFNAVATSDAVASVDAVACIIEWPDLDPRFGYREAGGWGLSDVAHMVSGARENLQRLRAALGSIPAGVRVAVGLPTLPRPPLFHTVGVQASRAELLLEEMLAEFAVRVADRPGTVLLNLGRLNEESTPADRLDLKSDLATGSPYTLAHADILASTFSRLLAPDATKKGIITDLDDTLWHGIAGELGSGGVTWDLASHHQAHGLYQKLLSSLGEAGILVAIASKNERAVVQEALQRPDLLIRSDQIFPIEAHWDAKSWSVARILESWNIGADSVIFVDDSPMELAEVAAAHPAMKCLRFPANQPKAVLSFLRSLRDLCGKEQVLDDDALRLESIRRGAEFKKESATSSTPDDFLRAANGTITFECNAGFDARSLELVNKTNQFNINGVRYTEGEWRKKLEQAGALSLVVSYQDKFGPLGKIAVVLGVKDGDLLRIEAWVMSCRAFARRIEYQCLRLLFDQASVERMEIQFVPTAKNKPTQEFLSGLFGAPTTTPLLLTRAQLEEKSPPLYHHITLLDSAVDEAIESVETNG